MKGSSVKKSIKIAGKTIAEVASKIGVSREHLGKLLGDDLDVDNTYLEKIKNLGIEVKEIKSEVNVKESLDYLKAENFWLKQQITLLEEFNKTVVNTNTTLNLVVTSKLTNSK